MTTRDRFDRNEAKRRDADQCYTCGRYAPSHHDQCPDHPEWRRRMPYLSVAEFDRLIPVGEWAYNERIAP